MFCPPGIGMAHGGLMSAYPIEFPSVTNVCDGVSMLDYIVK